MSNKEDEFEDLWRVVDLKKGKQQARKAFLKYSNYKYLKKFADLQNKTITEIYMKWKDGEYKSRGFFNEDGDLDKSKLSFLCHLSTWLNGHRWEDEHHIPEPEEKDLWFNSSTGIIEMGKSLGIYFVEDEEPFPNFKQRVMKEAKNKFGQIKGDENGIFSTRH